MTAVRVLGCGAPPHSTVALFEVWVRPSRVNRAIHVSVPAVALEYVAVAWPAELVMPVIVSPELGPPIAEKVTVRPAFETSPPPTVAVSV